MHRHKISRIVLLLVMGLMLSLGTACKRIQPGNGGVVVNLNGPDKGVDDLVVETGRIWYWPIGKAVYEVPFFMQRVSWTAGSAEGSKYNEEITFNSVEGTVIKTDVGFAWAVKRERIPHVFVQLRTNVNNITDGYMRSQVRGAIAECAEKMALDKIYGAEKTGISNCAFKKLGEVAFIGENFDLEYLTFIGAFRFDPEVQDAINAKIAAENQKKAAIETAMGKAQAIREVANAKRDAKFAAAEGNDRLRQSLTDDLLTYQRIKMMEDKWDGVMPKAMLGEGGGALLSFNMDDEK